MQAMAPYSPDSQTVGELGVWRFYACLGWRGWVGLAGLAWCRSSSCPQTAPAPGSAAAAAIPEGLGSSWAHALEGGSQPTLIGMRVDVFLELLFFC